MIEKNTPGAFITSEDFKEFVSDISVTLADENEFSDLRAKNLSFMRISIKVVKDLLKIFKKCYNPN